MRKSAVVLLVIFFVFTGFAGCRKSRVDYRERLEKIKKVRTVDEKAFVSHLSNLLKSIDRENPVYEEALELMVDHLVEKAGEWEDMGRYKEAADIYLQAGRMDRDNEKLKKLYTRARDYEDLTMEDFDKILIGMNNHDLHNIAGNPYKIDTKTDEKENTVHEYHFLTKANQWDSVMITLDDDLRIIDKKYPEIQDVEEQKE